MASVTLTFTDEPGDKVLVSAEYYPPIENLDPEKLGTIAQNCAAISCAFAVSWLKGGNPNVDGFAAEILSETRMGLKKPKQG